MVNNIVITINNSIKALLSNMKIRMLFVIMLIVFMGVMVGVFVVSTYKTIYKTIYQERVNKIKYVINFADDVLQYENFLVKSKQTTLKQAQKAVIEIFKKVRFENNDYIWVVKESGIMIYHPYPKMIGNNVESFSDIKKYKLGKQIVGIALSKGNGYATYYWTKIREQKDKHYIKLSYFSRFEPWGWIVGTGVYIDDIDNKVLSAMIMAIFPILFTFLLMSLIFRYIMLITIVIPIEELSNKSLRLAKNDLTVELPEIKSDNEFGKLYHSFNQFIQTFKEKRNSEKKLSMIMDNITDVLIIAEVGGKIISSNPAIEKVFGYTQEEVVGMNFDLLTSPSLFSGNPEDFTGITYFNDKYELTGIKKTGENFNIEIDLNELVYDCEDFFIILVRDTTVRKKFELSRELKTPMTETRGSLGVLLGGLSPEVTEEMKSLIDSTYNNSLKMVELINDILDIEKISAGKMEFNYEVLNVADIIEEAILINVNYAEKFKVEYKFVDNTPKNTLINADKKIFTQILTNLLLNAADFSPKNDEVIISANIKNDLLHISVKDNGQGIPESLQETIFGEFPTDGSPDTRRKGSISLGLNICKILVEEMQGSISFETAVGKGTTFHIYLPLHPNEKFNNK